MVVRRTEYRDMPIFEAQPPRASGRGVVVFHGAYGPDPHILAVLDRLADLGYRAIAPHLFHRTQQLAGPPVRDEETRKHRHALTEDGLTADIDASLAYLRGQGIEEPAATGVLGFCLGGAVVVVAAARREVGAAVTFYGSGVVESRMGMPALVDLAPELRAPWLGLYGDEDTSAPPDQVDALERAAQTSRVTTQVMRYPGAAHGFHNHTNLRSYRRPAAADGWQRAVDWFDVHLRGWPGIADAAAGGTGTGRHRLA